MLDISKKSLREQMRAKRQAFSKTEHERLSRKACERLVAMEQLVRATSVGLFYSVRSEISLQCAVDVLAATHKLYWPRCRGQDLDFVCAQSTADFVPGPFQLMEPQGDPAPLNDIEVIVVPGLLFDRSGHRLGYGAGYYDRTLADYKGTTIGVGFEFQVVGSLPFDERDVAVHHVVTDAQHFEGSA